MSFLFDEVIFGPVRSRRLGLSLGINLLPLRYKYCSYNCIYCECGWTSLREPAPGDLPTRDEVARYLRIKLEELAADQYLPDAITYAGNGEPTLHPDFAGIVDDTLRIRDELSPRSGVAVLSNATQLHRADVFKALTRLNYNIQKLDAGNDRLARILNHPVQPVSYDTLVDNLRCFGGQVIIQSMFLRGVFAGEEIDNTRHEETAEWIEQLCKIRPASVMIYSIARATPAKGLHKVPLPELQKIAERVQLAGIPVKVYE